MNLLSKEEDQQMSGIDEKFDSTFTPHLLAAILPNMRSSVNKLYDTYLNLDRKLTNFYT